MNLTANRLTATAGLCAAAAGAIFIGVQINHPPADVAHIVTTEMAVRESAKVLMAVLALVGFTGMFLRHRRRFGVLGLAGYLAADRRLPRDLRRPVHRRLRPPDGGALGPGLRPGRPRRGRRRQPERRHRPHAGAVPRLRHRLLARWSAVRHRAVPRRRPGPLGLPRCSPTAPPPPSRCPCCRSPSTARSRCPPASR